MRVLSVGNRYPPWSTGGYEVTWASTMAALNEAGHETRVLTTEPDPSDRSRVEPPEGVYRDLRWYWRENEFPAIGILGSVRLERFNAAVLRRHVAEFQPDIVMWWAMGGMSLSLLEQVRRSGLPAVAAVGDDWLAYGPQVDVWIHRTRRLGTVGAWAAERLAGVPARLDLEGIGRWAFNSQYTLDNARRLGWRLEDAVVVHPGVDPDRFATREPEPWRWRLLYCGRIDPRKGIDTAIQALALLPEEARLTIHGDGDTNHLADLKALAQQLGLADRVHFTHSAHDQVPDVYAAADAVLFPVTWREPWGLVPLEAMGIGRPLVASRANGGPAEYLEDGSNCLQFEPGDARGLAAAVNRLADQPELRAHLRERGRQTAVRYTERAFHEALEGELRNAALAATPADTMAP